MHSCQYTATRRSGGEHSSRVCAADRQALTDSEALLWEALRRRQLGVQFRRQVPLAGRYIADFYATALRLVVEVDGSSHRGRENTDARRDRASARAAIGLVRVRADLVMRDARSAAKLVARHPALPQDLAGRGPFARR